MSLKGKDFGGYDLSEIYLTVEYDVSNDYLLCISNTIK